MSSTLYVDKLVENTNGSGVDLGTNVKVGGNIIASHTGVEGAGEVTLQNVTLGDSVTVSLPSVTVDTAGEERMRITSDGLIVKKSPHTSSDQYVESFFSKYVSTSNVDIFTVDMNATHEAMYYEVIAYGGDWASHSAARVCKRGFINGYNGYIGHEVLESGGQYGDNILSNVTWTSNGGVATFQLRLDTGGVTLRGHIRLIGSFSTYTIG